MNFTVRADEIMLLAFLASLAYSVIFLNRLSLKISGIIFGAAAIVGAIYFLCDTELFKSFVNTAFSAVHWLTDYISWAAKLDNRYEDLVACFLSILVPLPVYVFTAKKFNFYVLLISGAGLFASQWMLDYFVSYLPFYVFLFLIIVCYFKYIFVRSSSAGPNDFAAPAFFTMCAAPVCGLAFLLALSIPASDKPIEWEWLDSKIVAFYDFLNSRLGHYTVEYFSLASTGFGDGSGRLGGKVKLDKTLVMKVESPTSGLYLKGASREIYTGWSWENSSSELLFMGYRPELSNFHSDILELKEGTKFIAGRQDLLKNYFRKDTVKIQYENMKTKTIFIPLKTEKISFGTGPVSIFADLQGMLSGKEFLGKNFEYSVETYNNINRYGGEFTEVLRRSRKGLYDGYLAMARARANRFGRFIAERYNFARRLSMVAQDAYSRYLQLPESLPQRVKDMARNLTSAAKNDYDKVKAIETYLSKNYLYTLNPPRTPSDRDFVDYFLFDLKQGYCTYYASAMTVLVRSIGIPARYVEGYVLPPMPTSGDTYEVTNEQAHAWVEVYFEGFGWVPFEPTSPFTASFYSGAGASATASGSNPGTTPYDDYIGRMEQYKNEKPSSQPQAGYSLGTEVFGDKVSAIIKLALPVSIIMMFLAVLISNIIRREFKLRRILRLPPGKCVLAMYKHFIRALALLNMPIKPGETPVEYAGRVDMHELFKPVDFKAVTDVFIKARYSDGDISESDRKLVVDFYKPFMVECKKRMGKIRYFLYRNILGLI